MKDSRKVAIGRFVLRNKEHLAAIRPMGDVLTMATMRFHDEVVSPKDLDGEVFEEEKPTKPEKREVEMAKQLIESLSTDFKADKYRDEYREELLDLLERKAEGKEVVTAPERGARADQGSGPDGRPRGEPRGCPKRRRRRRRQGRRRGCEGEAKGQVPLNLKVEVFLEGEALFAVHERAEERLAQEDQGLAASGCRAGGQRSGIKRSRSADGS